MSENATKQDIEDIKELLKESQAQLLKDVKTYVDGKLQEQDAYIDSKFVGIDEKFVGIDAQFTEVHKEIDDLAQSTAKAFEHVETRFDLLENRFDKHAIDIDKMEAVVLNRKHKLAH